MLDAMERAAKDLGQCDIGTIFPSLKSGDETTQNIAQKKE